MYLYNKTAVIIEKLLTVFKILIIVYTILLLLSISSIINPEMLVCSFLKRRIIDNTISYVYFTPLSIYFTLLILRDVLDTVTIKNIKDFKGISQNIQQGGFKATYNLLLKLISGIAYLIYLLVSKIQFSYFKPVYNNILIY